MSGHRRFALVEEGVIILVMNAPTPLAEGLPHRRFTVDDVMRMVEIDLIDKDERLEILDGEIIEMSPKGSRHEAIKIAVNLLWGRVCPDGFNFAPETGLRLADRTYLEPDFIAFSAATRKADVTGPDVLLAVEVADSSLDYDLKSKPGIYASFGVRELWVIDATRREAIVHREPGPDGYAHVERHMAASRLEPLAAPVELAFALDDLPDV